MSTRYFILAQGDSKMGDAANDQITTFAAGIRRVHLLPQVNLDYYVRNSLFEAPLIEWSTQFCKPDKVFLDIGAHTGTYAISLAPHCGTVHCFEPQRMTYYALCGGVALSGQDHIICHPEGLGSPEQVGYQMLNIVSHDGGGSSLHWAPGQPAPLAVEVIEVRTLDSYNLEKVSFIKMDVEDNEPDVLAGGLETLRKSGMPPILFEANGPSQTLIKVTVFLEPLNYKVIPVAGVSNMFLAVSG